MNRLLRTTALDLKQCWKQLLVTAVIYKALAFILLAPFVAILFRVLIALSGPAVLADQDILFFLLAPAGWFCIIAVGAFWLAIAALEMSALMAILVATRDGRWQINAWRALRFASSKAVSVVHVAARMVGWTLLTIAPFLAVAAVVYSTLLTDYDINYYLKEKPPVFLAALCVAAIIVVALTAVLLRMFTGWFFALPLVLFEEVKPSQALRASRERASGNRRTLLLWILGWFMATTALSAIGSSMVIGSARWFVPRATGSLATLTIAIGLSLLVWLLVNLIVSLLSTTTFAAVLVNLFRQLGRDGEIQVERMNLAEGTARKDRFQFSRNRVLAACTLGIVVAVAIGVLAVRSVRLEDNVEIIAHRGASHAAPENTLAAIRKAIEEGADWVEIDVQETADDEVVVFHDSDFMKLAGVDLKIWDATMDDLSRLDVGSWLAPQFKDERVPTLGEVLDLCKGRVNVVIELKYYGHDKQLEQRVVEIVEAHGMTDNVISMSLEMAAVKKLKAIRPGWKVGLLMSLAAGDLRKIEADFLAVNATFADRSLVRAAHAIDKEVYVWTVNDVVGMSTMIGRGVDGLITDKPAWARSVLEQRAQLSPTERLLLELAGVFGVPAKIGEQ